MKPTKLLFAAFAALIMSLGAFAAPTAKAVLVNSGTTLKFVYDEKSYGTKGTDWFSVREAEDQEQTLDTNKPWYEASSSVTRVVFDDSFAAYRPKNCYQWFYYFDKLTRVVGMENLDVSSATNLGFMFGFCKALQTIDISQFDTSAAKSIMGMFNGCTKLNTIYASDRFVTTALTDKNEQVFSGCSTNLKGGNGTVWSSTNVKADFARCDIPDWPGYFTVKEPTVVWNSADTSLTFYFKPAKELPSGSTYTRFYLPANGVTPGWISDMKVYGKPTKVTIDASFADCRPSTCYMWFYGMSGVTDIKGLYNLNVSKVTDSYGLRMMFSGCSKVTKLDLSSFDTANVPSFQSMFEGCSALTTIYATEKFVVKSGAGSTDMFKSCSTDLRGGNGTTWSSDKATNKTYAKIDKAGQSGYFTAAPVAVSAVNTLTFYADGADHSGSGLTIYPVAAAETGDPLWKELGSTVTKAVFDSSFKGYRPTSCASWFEGFGEMTAVEGLDNVNTSEATSFSFMFYDCGKLTSLNLESFDTAKVKDTSNMFNGCSKLATITVSDGFVTTQVTSSPNMFANCNSLKGGNGTAWASGNPMDKTYARIDTATTPGYFTAKVALAVWNSSWKTLMFYYNVPKKIPTYDGQFSVADAEKIDLTKDEVPWYSTCAGSATKVDFDASFAAYRPKKCVKWFAKFENLAYIRGIENLNVSDAVDLTSMFYGCGKLRVLDLSNFTTSKVTSMISMFAECSALESIYATEYFTTVKLDPSFGGYGMFHGCTSIRGENGTTYDSSKTDQAYAHIDEAGNKGYFSMPPTAVLSSDGKTLTFYADGAAHAGKATYSVGAALMDEPDVAMPWIADAKGSVTTVAFDSSFRKCRPVHCGGWFYGFTKLTNVKSAKNLTLSSATHLGSMFAYCSALESLYVFAWDTSKVENMKQMFNGCTKLKKVVVSADGFSTASVTESSSMFNGCSALTGGYGTVYDSGKTDATYARGDTKTQKGYFTYPAVARYNLKTLTFYCDGKDHSGSVGIVYDVNDSAYDVEQDWSGHKGEATDVVFDASFLNYRPTSCYGWFTDFSALTAVSGLENLDVSRCEYLTSLFEGCSALTTLDLSTFDTAKVQEFDGMFLGCTKLKTILASDKFSLASKTSAADMFDGCEALVGGNGTAYATAKVVDASYAHVDAVDNPGYFTGLLAPVAVYDDTTKTLTFYYDNLGHSGAGKEVFSVQEASDSDPTSPVVPWSGKTDVTKVVFDSSFAAFQPKHCAQWFMGFSAVTAFGGLENLDVSKATRLSSMFKNCSSVTTFDLSTWNTANVTHMTGMFSGCSALTAIYASPAFTTAKVTTTAGKTGTFTGCTKLPNFDPAKITADQAYIGAGGYLSEKPGVDTARAIYDATAKTLTFVYDKSHHYGEKAYLVADAEKIDPASEDVPWYADCHETVTKVVFDTAFAGYQPTKLGGWFKYFTALTEIEGLDNLDTSAATSMKMMFSGCSALAALDVSGFNTANVKDMSYLFWECKALTVLDVSSFVTDKVTDMTWMFKDCKKLTTIYAGSGFTAAGADGTSMFHGCSALVGGAGTTYAGQPSSVQQGKEYARIDNPPGTPGFFSEKGKKKTAHAVYADATKTLTFYYDSVDHSSEGTVYEIPATAKAPDWYTDGTLAKVEKAVFDVTFADFRPTTCYSWFDGAKEMATIEGLENLDTSDVLRMDYMFLSCAKLVSLDLTALNVAKVTSMEGMFANCTALTTLDVQSWNTPKVEKMSGMFRNCPLLKRIYAYDTFETTSVTDGGKDMFFGCECILGGSGTTYEYPNVGVAYAQVDGQGGKPGYFTKYDPLAVTFDPNGGALADPSESPKMVLVDEKVGTLPVATRDGFVFSGWFTEKTGGTKVTEETVIEIPVTFYAQWSGGLTVVEIPHPEADLTLVYTGSELNGFKNVDSRLSHSGDVTATDAGDYGATFTLPVDTKTETYQWVGGGKSGFAAVWSIAARDVTDSGVTFAAIPDQTHTGKAIEPPVTMTFAGKTKTAGTDYTVAYSDNVNVGTATATVTGNGNFTGMKALTFKIVDSPEPPGPEPTVVKIAKPTAVADLLYAATEQTGVVFDSRLSSTFTGSVKSVNAGNYIATFALPGNTSETTYKWADDTTGPVDVSWSIAPRPVDDEGVAVTEIEDQFYTGAAIEPVVAMSYGGQVCELGVDYTVAYADNVNVGTATATVTGLGNFSGMKTVAFEIKEAPAGSSVVTFDKTEGVFVTEATRSVETGTAVGALPITYSMTKEFVGWFTAAEGGDPVTAETVVTGDVTFYAQWQEPPAGSHYVLFQGNGGTLAEYIRFVEDGQPLGELPACVRAGYDFDGWFTAQEGGEPVTAETVVTADMIVHAQWTPTVPTVVDVTDPRVTFGALADEEYVCGENRPAVEMFFNGEACEQGVDYEVTYSNNLRVGTGYALVTGIGGFGGEKALAFRILPIAVSVGEYLEADLEDDLGVVIDEIDGIKTEYKVGDKATVKVEGLAKGLKLAQDRTTQAWILSGVPTETALFKTQPMFARVTVTYKDRTKGVNGKAEKLCQLPLDIVPAEVRTLTAGVLSTVFKPVDIATLWPEAADAKANPKDWSFKGWPAGISYNNTAADKVWTYKDPETGTQVKTSASPYEVYGLPTKAGTFTVTATHKFKPVGATAAVSETLQAAMTVWADADEKSYRCVDQVGVATTNVALGADVKSVAGLPTGLKFANGKVSGVPTKAGVFAVALTMGDKSKETFLWLVDRGENDGVLSKIGWTAKDATVSVMQGVIKSWSVDVPAGAKVTVTGLPAGLAFKQDAKTKLWTFAGTPTKEGNYVVTFKTVLNGETVTERISIVVKPNEWTGNWYGVQKDAYAESSLNVLVNVAANGTVKLTLQEGREKTTVKTSVTAKNLNADGHSATLEVVKQKVVQRTFTVDFAAGAFTIDGKLAADLCETTVSVAADKSVRTFVLENVADGVTNAYAYVTATYDAKKATFALAGKLWDGTAVKGTASVLDKQTKTDGNFLSPVLLADKAKNAVYLELSDDGSWCRVIENGDEQIAIGKDGTTPWTDFYLADELRGKTIAGLAPETTACVVLAVDAASAPRQKEVVIDGLMTKELGTKLAADGLAKLTLTDKFGWKWVCEMLPIDNDAKMQFRGIATGTMRGEATQYAPVWSK